MLTARQAELLSIIVDGVRETGDAPTYQVMSEAMRLRSKSGIHRMVLDLEERGFIRRRGRSLHGIEVLRVPAGIGDFKPRDRGLSSVALKGYLSTTVPMRPTRAGGSVLVPAGMTEGGDCYAARITGDGVPELQEGDLVVVERTDARRPGDLNVVMDAGLDYLVTRSPSLAHRVVGRIRGMMRSSYGAGADKGASSEVEAG